MNKNNTIKSIGLDISLTGTGLVILEKGKIIQQKLIKSKPIPNGTPRDEVLRMLKIVEEIEDVVSEYNPTIAVIEGLAFGIQKTTSLTQLAALNFFTRARLIDYRIPFVIVFPTTLKKFITGSGASKKDVLMMEIYKRWGVSIADNNEADAYSLAQVGLALFGGNSKAITKFQQEVINLLKKQLQI